MIHRVQKDVAAAEREYRSALAQHPDSVTVLTSLGGLLTAAERYDEAMELTAAYLRRRPTDMAALYQLGRIGALSGKRLDRAEEALRTYLRHTPKAGAPSLAAAHWRLGMIQEKRGDGVRARQEYEAALRLDPKFAGARAALSKLQG